MCLMQVNSRKSASLGGTRAFWRFALHFRGFLAEAAFPLTETELADIAASAIMGERSVPNTG